MPSEFMHQMRPVKKKRNPSEISGGILAKEEKEISRKDICQHQKFFI